MAKKASNDDIPFEKALTELESLVETMEQGDLGLEESLGAFERGIALTRICQQALRDAEQKIAVLTKASTDAELDPFEGDDRD